MSENNNQNASLLRRAFMFLEDGEWEKADQYADKVLDGEPENYEAYLCKLLSELRIVRKESLPDAQAEITESKNYANAFKNADESQKKFLEDCAQKAHSNFLEQEKIKSCRNKIKTFSDIIDTYRKTQQSNREMIRRGESAAKMYTITYIVAAVYLALIIVIASLNLGKDGIISTLALPLGIGVGIHAFGIVLWIGHARMVRFWDLDYGNDRGWLMPFFFGMLNCFFMLGIWGLVKTAKTRKECKGLNDNNAEMERQIADLQRQIEKTRELMR